jgi:transcription antitermination factor NusG
MDWYVIHTYSGHENKVKANLERAIHAAGLEDHFGQILVATEEFAEMKDGKRITSKRKTFPSYVLVEMNLDMESRLVVQNVPGVTRFVGSGQDPIPLREAEVKRILGHMEAGGRCFRRALGPPRDHATWEPGASPANGKEHGWPRRNRCRRWSSSRCPPATRPPRPPSGRRWASTA